MNHPTNQQVLRLYKHLLKYGNQLQFTDKWYYMNKIRDEFKLNKSLKKPEEIEFCFKVNATLIKRKCVRCFKIVLLLKRGEALLKNKRIV